MKFDRGRGPFYRSLIVDQVKSVHDEAVDCVEHSTRPGPGSRDREGSGLVSPLQYLQQNFSPRSYVVSSGNR